jgi:hypothetical protein
VHRDYSLTLYYHASQFVHTASARFEGRSILDDCQTLVLQIHVLIIQTMKVKKVSWHDDMASEMLNSLMRVWNGNYCSSWPFTTLLGRACVTLTQCRMPAVSVYLVHKILSASLRHHTKCQKAAIWGCLSLNPAPEIICQKQGVTWFFSDISSDSYVETRHRAICRP